MNKSKNEEAGPDAQASVRERVPTPTWVKAFGVIGFLLVAVVVASMLIGGNHGPSRHSGMGGVEKQPTLQVGQTIL